MSSGTSSAAVDDVAPQNNKQIVLQAPELPIGAVTVYLDRAEVQRAIPLKLATGLNQVLIENVAPTIIGDTVRVDGRGASATTIHEVQFKEEHMADDKVTSTKIESVRAELDTLQARIEPMQDIIALLGKQCECVHNMLSTLFKPNVPGQQPQQIHFDAQSEQSVDALCAYHERKELQLKERIRVHKKEAKALEDNIQKLKDELRELQRKGKRKMSIAVTLENNGPENADVELTLIYQVHSVSWKPSYDIRVAMDGTATMEQLRTVQLNYFGMIKQHSGEQWENVKLALSTAKPMGGNLPKLGTTYAQFVPKRVVRSDYALFGAAQMQPAMQQFGTHLYTPQQQQQAMAPAAPDDDEQMGFGVFEVAEAKADEQFLSATFQIAQPKTLPDDDSEHKVTIAILELACQPHLDCVPSKNTNVFMSGTLLNQSAYELLAGPAAVYMNNCYTQHVNIEKPICVGEKFDVSLGVYSAIKITYKPTHKFHHQTGMINKSSNLVHEQKILVKNTRPVATLLKLLEPVPKSTDEKIKIHLISPELSTAGKHSVTNTSSRSNSTSVTSSAVSISSALLKQAELELRTPLAPGAALNSDNNLEWTVQLEAGKEVEYIVKWEVEYPPAERIEFKEKK